MMKTKLVFVLSCTRESNYIEQALISIWSARYHNPDAYIVLIVDVSTNELFVGSRKEVLSYVSEKIVVEVPGYLEIIEQSRYIKTNVRKLIKGDFLFIDCDTIVCRSLRSVDDCVYDVAAVLDNHQLVQEYEYSIKRLLTKRWSSIGVDFNTVSRYFSSGVMYVKDTEISHQLYEKWHTLWFQTISNGFIGDQPFLLKANLELGEVITELPGVWNTVMYTYPFWIKQAYILHFSGYENMCFLFDKHFLSIICDEGLTKFKELILHPEWTYIANIWNNPILKAKDMLRGFKLINMYSPNSLNTFLIKVRRSEIVSRFVRLDMCRIAVFSVFLFDCLYLFRKKMSRIKKYFMRKL